ncbi:MAG: DNA polymerase beta superfamily protein [Gimesia chilikensis]|uniref:nucleotidyltransferase domain-containing protein n=1 Tax=Gimesia chilikensis TaxID=2605989 RepID=UPI0037A98203
MNKRVHYQPNLIYSDGTQVVTVRDIIGPNGRTQHPRGSVGVVVRAPRDLDHSYRVKFPDGVEVALKADELTLLAQFKEGEIGNSEINANRSDLFSRVIFKCIIGSRAFGLEDEQSDTDYRGVYLPPAELQWSLYGVPEQLDCHETQETYWELQKFLVLALKANPNVLECLYTPLVEQVTPLGQELLDLREIFLTRIVYQTYNGYVMSQFKKMQTDIKNQGMVKWKHVMHLIRLLISGVTLLREGYVVVDVGPHREQLLAIKRGEVSWEETEKWRKSLHKEFEQALEQTRLPARPDYETANNYLIKARRLATQEALP